MRVNNDTINITLPRPSSRPASSAEAAPGDRVELGQAPPVEVGSHKDFWVWDMSVMPPGFKQVPATCRAVGEDGYVFVDDGCWNKTVFPTGVEALNERFNHSSPAGSVDPSKSVAAIDKEYFGPFPVGLNQDPKTYLVVTDLATFNGTTMDGYVNGFDAMPEKQAWEQYQQHSNEANVLYLNANQKIDSDYMLGVMAHEYQHISQNAHDPEEESWLNEMISEAAMKVNGYHTDMGHVKRHLAKPERPLVSDTYVDYGANFLFGAYLLERFGKTFFQDLSVNPDHGVASVDSTLKKLGRPERFTDLFRDWAVANYADSKGAAAPGLHYATLDLPRPAETVFRGQAEAKLAPTGVNYVRFDKPEALNLKVEGGPGLDLQLLQFLNGQVERTLVIPGSDGKISLPAGSDRVLVVANLGAQDLKVSLQASR